MWDGVLFILVIGIIIIVANKQALGQAFTPSSDPESDPFDVADMYIEELFDEMGMLDDEQVEAQHDYDDGDDDDDD